MKFRNLLLVSLLMLFATACKTPGDFCVSATQIPLKDETIGYLARNDIDAGRSILSHNTYGERECGWVLKHKVKHASMTR